MTPLCPLHTLPGLLHPLGHSQDLQAEAGGADRTPDFVQQLHQQAEDTTEGPEAHAPEVGWLQLKGSPGFKGQNPNSKLAWLEQRMEIFMEKTRSGFRHHWIQGSKGVFRNLVFFLSILPSSRLALLSG